ncbi:MAG: hypothetical protein GF399_11170 [Candidatus Coatesbacteria bacterium]|nr:hypothetical protein [Candidatus Coatesbacteria bacterium]
MKSPDTAPGLIVNININLIQAPAEELDPDEHVWLIEEPVTAHRSPLGL